MHIGREIFTSLAEKTCAHSCQACGRSLQAQPCLAEKAMAGSPRLKAPGDTCNMHVYTRTHTDTYIYIICIKITINLYKTRIHIYIYIYTYLCMMCISFIIYIITNLSCCTCHFGLHRCPQLRLCTIPNFTING